jgi:hypothetical protein
METGEILKYSHEFYDDNLKNRIVTWLDWSPQVSLYKRFDYLSNLVILSILSVLTASRTTTSFI